MHPEIPALVRFAARLIGLGALALSSPAYGQPQKAPVPAETDHPASASDGIRPEHIWTAAYAKLVWADTLSIVKAPSGWDERDWLEAGGAIAAVAITVPVDHAIRKHVQANRTAGGDRFFKQWQNFGYPYSFAILGGFEAWGELGENTRAKNVAMDGLTSSIIAAGLITPTLKFVVGRDRPRSNQGTYKFEPFTRNISFPSGHAAQAFAVATVIAHHYPEWWVETLTFGSAALVGYARIERDEHFASDVVAGAIIGWAVARSIVHRHDGPRDPNKLNWSPYGSGNGGGLVFFKTF